MTIRGRCTRKHNLKLTLTMDLLGQGYELADFVYEELDGAGYGVLLLEGKKVGVVVKTGTPRDRNKKLVRTEMLYELVLETAGPLQDSCPERILEQLPPTEAPKALEWRRRCRQNLALRALLKPGAVFEFLDPPSVTAGGKLLKLRYQGGAAAGASAAVVANRQDPIDFSISAAELYKALQEGNALLSEDQTWTTT